MLLISTRRPRPSARPARLFIFCGIFAGSAMAAVSFARIAGADDIRVIDPNTGEATTEKVAEIVTESWTEIAYRPTVKSPIKKIPTRLVLEVNRGSADDAQAQHFGSAKDDLERGRYTEAKDAFGNLGGGGMQKDEASGSKQWVAFNGNDSAGKPKWYAEYAHLYYAKAAYLEGKNAKDKASGAEILEKQALRALDWEEAKSTVKDKPPEKGFLARFKEGKSRYYADALLLKAQILAALGKYDDAAAAYEALYDKAINQPIGYQWAYWAKLGPGQIAEAKGQDTDAVASYEAAAAALESLVAPAPDPASRMEIGRYWNEARSNKSRIMLGAAEKQNSPAAFGALQKYLEEGTPEALQKRFSKYPPEVANALIDGARSPTVQAVTQNGIGLAQLANKQWTQAILTFTAVRAKYFAVTDQVPRALRNLALAADGAAAAATRPEAKLLFQAQAKAARDELERLKPK